MMFDRPMPSSFNGFPDDSDFDGPIHKKGQKGKHKNDKKFATGLTPAYQGCTLQKAPARAGEFESWARVGHRPLHGGDAELAQQSRKYRKEVGRPFDAFALLSPDQQGVVNRYIEAKQLQEDDKHAEWTLDCVYRHRRPVVVKNAWSRGGLETRSITVIIRRQDRNAPVASKTSYGRSNTFAAGEIIDINEPHTKAKDGKKGNKKEKDIFIPRFDDFPPNNFGPDPPRNPDFVHVPHPPPLPAGGSPRFDHVPVPPPPLGAIHVNQYPPPQTGQQNPFESFPPPQHGPQIPFESFPPPQPGSRNPFEPFPHLNTPDLYENFQDPMNVDPQFQTRRQTPILEERRSRSRSRERRRQSRERRRHHEQEEARRHEEALRLEREEQLEEDRRQQRANQQRTERILGEIQGNLQEQQDQMHDLTGQFAQLSHGRSRYSTSSDDSQYRDHLEKVDMWSLPTGGSFTPPSSSGRRSPMLPSGTIGRKLYRDHGRKVYPIERRNSRYHRDKMVVLEPYTTLPRARDIYQQGRRRDLEDDYPRPPAPMPPMDPGRRHRPQIHQRAATFANDETAFQPLALPQYPAQEYAQFTTHPRRGREERKRRDSDHYGGPREMPAMYAHIGERDRRGGIRSDRVLY
ncbi:hypothetical protein BST61_g215 [Cercospora zeina]